MNTLEQIEQIYNSELKDSIAKYSGIRKKMHQWKNIAILIIVLTLALLFVGNTVTRIISSTVGLLVAIYVFALAQYEYKKLIPFYKKEVVARVIKIINPEFLYSINDHVENHIFNESKIFTTESFECDGDDMVTGKIGKTEFKFSELHARQEYFDEKGVNKGSNGPTIFHGIFFCAEFNKKINGKTLVLPNKHKDITTVLGHEKLRSEFYGELVKLENKEFEEMYSVYSDSQQEARYIITPVMMEAMVQVFKAYKRPIYFSFIGDNVYCAINFYNNNGVIKGLFEPSGKKTDTDFNEIKEIYHLFSLIETVINEMNLNTRIWTKE